MKDNLTIGYVLDDTLDVSDGVQQAMITIAEKMRSNGHEVHYIVPKTERNDLKNIHSIGNFWSMKFNGNSVRTPLPSSSKQIKKLYAEVNFDVIHVQMPYSPFFAAKVIKHAPEDTKIYGTFHILPYNIFSKLGTKLLSFTLKKSNRKIIKSYAVSKPANNFMKSHFGLSGTVLPNPVDYEFFNNANSEKNKKFSVVYVGRFEERKGVIQLAEAYSSLSDNYKNKIELTMCGKGPLLEKVKKYSNGHKLNIKLPGFVSEIQKASNLAGSDIAIFPSISGESFGIVLTEAMSSGAGITLGGDNPGYHSVLHEWPETLFNPTNIEEITNKIITLYENKDLRESIGKQQHEYVKKFDINKIVKKLESDYSS